MKKISLFALVTLVSAIASAETWSGDPVHSRLGFGITHMTITEINGNFKAFKATVTTTSDDFADASVELSAEISSINTDNEQRDTHLKNADFFDAEKFPTLTFKSTTFKKVGDKKFKIMGNLTMHGVTKPVEMEAVLNGTATNPMSKKLTAGFHVTGIVKRSDFGIGPKFPEPMLGDAVKLIINLELPKN